MHVLKSSLIRFELKTYQGVKQLWTKWAKFKRYVKIWKEEGGLFFPLFSLVFRACFLFLQITKKTKNKNNFFFPHNGVRSWLAYPKSLRFQVFSPFLIRHDCTRCTAKSMHSREDKKKTFPYYFWFAAIAQGARQRAYVAEKTRKKTFPFYLWFGVITQGAWKRAYAARECNSPTKTIKIS